MSIKKELKVVSFIKKHKLKKKGDAPIFMKIRFNNEQAEFGIREGIEPKLWCNKLGRVKERSKKAKKINEVLDKYERKIYLLKELLDDEGAEVTAYSIKEKLLGKKENRRTIVKVFQEHNDNARKLIGIDFAADTVQRYETTLMHFKTFLKKQYNREDITFLELSPHMIK